MSQSSSTSQAPHPVRDHTFIISRTDAIGDVVLTLPVAGVLRSLYPSARILFLGRAYTRDIIDACTHIDGFLDWDQLKESSPAAQLAATGADTIIHIFPDKTIARAAWKARIPQRIGTTNRLYHWLYCNIRVPLSRKNSPWHEAQLNLRLLGPLGAREKLYTGRDQRFLWTDPPGQSAAGRRRVVVAGPVQPDPASQITGQRPGMGTG
jgi:ADP-heptose:LPS heptosyltransferase